MCKFKFFKYLAGHMPPALVAGAVIEAGKKGVEKIMEHGRGTNKKMENINKPEENSHHKTIESLGKAANDEVADTGKNNTESQLFKP